MDKNAIWNILIKPLYYWVFTIIPNVLGVLGFIQDQLPADKKDNIMMQIYNLIPPWGWMIIGEIAFAITILVSTSNYIKEYKKNLQQFIISSHSINQSGGVTVENARDVIYNEKDNRGEKDILNKISKFVKIAIDNIVDYGKMSERDDKITREQRREKAFKNIDNLKKYFNKHISDLPPQTNELFQKLIAAMEGVMKYKYVCLCEIRNTWQLIESKAILPNQIGEVKDINKLDQKLYEIQKQILDEFYKMKK